MSALTKKPAQKLEVHRHSFVSGPRANRSVGWPEGTGSELTHSHEGGDTPHRHPDTGPSCFTIDAKRWRQQTGLGGGGKKKYTKAPQDLQLERIDIPPSERIVRVYVCASAVEGPGTGVLERMVAQFGVVPVFEGES